jgi:hypothetical protein
MLTIFFQVFDAPRAAWFEHFSNIVKTTETTKKSE